MERGRLARKLLKEWGETPALHRVSRLHLKNYKMLKSETLDLSPNTVPGRRRAPSPI